MKHVRTVIKMAAGLTIAAFVLIALLWKSFVVDVPPGKCLVLVRKSGADLPAEHKFAREGQKGIQRETLGPGRYVLNPWVWDTEIQPLVEIDAGDPATWVVQYDETIPDYHHIKVEGKLPEVGIRVNRAGKLAPPGSPEVVDEGFQGIQRDVLTPGSYRINPYAYEIKKVLATVIPLGCVGVVTSQLGEMPGVQTVSETVIGPDGQPVKGQPKVTQKLAESGQRGVLRNVLQPGIYYLNPYVHKVQVLWVGYNLMSQFTKAADPSEAISFPSKDGFTIDLDVTVVWGMHPDHAPEMINHIGDAERIKQIILSQIRSICRNVGSEYLSTDFIQGEKRELYQREVTETLQRACREKDIEILIALILNIEVHGGTDAKVAEADLKSTIQRGFIAREQDLTKQMQQQTAKVRAELEAARATIPVSREKVSAETRMKVAEIQAEARKKAEEIDAQRDLEVARIERQIADLEADTMRLLGRAAADVERLKNQAEAEGKKMMIEAFGSGRAYNLYTFAQGFAPDNIRLFFAGEGTFWTDLSKMQEAAAGQLLGGPPNGPAKP